MAMLYDAGNEDVSGQIIEVRPNDGKKFTYEELKKIVEGMVEIVPLPSGKVVVVNEKGKLMGLPVNKLATQMWMQEYPIEKYPHNNDELIVGNALVCEEKEIR